MSAIQHDTGRVTEDRDDHPEHDRDNESEANPLWHVVLHMRDGS